MSPRWKTWLRRVALALAAAELLYLVAANVFLNSSVAGVINTRPERLSVEWDGGWTVLPGLARLHGVRLRGQSKDVQWYAELDSVRVSTRLLALAGKHFHARGVDGRGLVFRLRERLKPGEETQAHTPPIPGLENPPRVAPEDLYPPPRKDREPWVVELDDVAVDEVREIWLQQYRFAGDGSVGGRLRLEVRGPLEVDRTTLNLDSGAVYVGEEPIVDAIDLGIAGRLAPFVPREQKPGEVLRHVTADVRLASPRASFGFLDAYLRGAKWLGIDGEGKIDAVILVRSGELASGTRVDVEDARFAVDYLDYRASGHGRLEAGVEDATPAAEAVIDAIFDEFEIGRHAEVSHIRGRGLHVVARSPELDLAEPGPAVSMTLDLPPSEVADLTFYNDYLPAGSGFSLRSGSGTVSGHLELSTVEKSGAGHFELVGKQIAAGFGDRGLVGDLALTARLMDADPVERYFRLAATRLELRRVAVTGKSGQESRDWWATVELPAGEVRMTRPLELDAEVRARLRDTRPILALAAEKKPLIGWMMPLLDVEDVRLAARIGFAGEELSLRDVVVEGEDLEVLADLKFADKLPTGLLFVSLGPWSAALELDQGERDWKLTGSRKWYEEKLAAGR